MMKKHQRPTQKLRQGGIIERESPLALSNVLVSAAGATSRRARDQDARRRAQAAVCKRCGESIDKG